MAYGTHRKALLLATAMLAIGLRVDIVKQAELPNWQVPPTNPAEEGWWLWWDQDFLPMTRPIKIRGDPDFPLAPLA